MARTSSETRISLKKIARAAIAETRVHKKILIITLVLYGAAFLLFIFDASLSRPVSGEISFTPSAVGAVFASFGVMVGFFAALNAFRDMNHPQICDISLALPIRSSERFLSRILFLFLVQAAPLSVSLLAGNGLVGLYALFRYGQLPENFAGILFSMFFGYLAAAMFLMSVTVLCTCCCGAMAESAYFSLIWMFIVNALPMAVLYRIFNCAGFDRWWLTMLGDRSFDFLRNWGLLYLIGNYDDVSEMIPFCAAGSLISLAVMLLAGLIYRRRDARTVGNPIASRLFFEGTMFVGCATVFSFFFLENGAFWGVLIAGVIYIVISVIVSRAKIGVKSFFLWCGKYLVTTLACFGFFTAALRTGGFGLMAARPAAEYLAQTSFRIQCRYGSREAPILTTGVLSAEQADQVMTIWKRYIAEGGAGYGQVSVWDDSVHRGVLVSMNGSGRTAYRECPSPGFLFHRTSRYYSYEEERLIKLSEPGWLFEFDQSAWISDESARAMFDELARLPFVDRIEPSDYSETYVPAYSAG